MREIKFRAWDKENKGYVVEPCAIFGERVMVQRGGSLVDVPNAIPLQYTGLKDKNGKEIWEGDVLSYPDTESEYVDVGVGEVKVAESAVNSFAAVIYQNGAFGIDVCEGELWKYEKGFKSFDWIETNEWSCFLNNVEVIGNIYENPELLQS